ncbi:ParE-like toxin of type II ParDE toxin-antitoxin system [Prosthecobacter fusiformis]|uniref:ParE-like toxin of type II ParDE toxin-antitoxin system n=1 Tax=Prosthecobacter fusiformis TaxID=48464 RepID=A0A4R7RJ50_9BACT|nr:type II toxin-antitoxin system RelE/ParE family toxin [Prosthecobacter fusiformis]TDU64138.1 ParE-like toxin of type II ParDE toxin-antitoxin system [Prosthecobacter fusiformis]
MKILWHKAAVFELEEAALYYGGVDDELGLRFTAAAEVAIAEIKARPEMRRKFDGEARKARLKRFPYAVVYWIEDGMLRIIAVMHLHREPGYWHGRLRD